MTYRRETVTTEEVVEEPAVEPAGPAPAQGSVNINAPQGGTTEPAPATADENVAVDDGETQVNVN